MTALLERKLSDAELDALDQERFERDYEQWCYETERKQYEIYNMSAIRKLESKQNNPKKPVDY